MITSAGPGSPSQPRSGSKPSMRAAVGIVDPVHRRTGVDLGQGVRDPRHGARHAEGQTLDDADGPVAVHDEPGQPVGLAPAEAKSAVTVRRRAATVEGRAEAAAEQRRVDGLVRTGDEPAGQGRARVVEAAAEQAACHIDDVDGVSRRP